MIKLGAANDEFLEKRTFLRPFLPSREVGDVDEGVVERGVDVGDGEHLLTLANLRSEGDLNLLDLLLLSLAWSHFSKFGTI